MEAAAGWDEAVALVQKREARKHQRAQQPQGKPIFGMPGVTTHPDGRPDLRPAAQQEYPELR